MKNRGSFSSRFGTIAAATGSAIGLGNIWRFPYVAGENGGAAFILIYLIIIVLIGLPILMSEFSLGRFTKKNIFGAFRKLSPKGHWYLLGVLGIIAAFTILSFYSVVAGWTLSFLKDSLTNQFQGLTSLQITDNFDSFVAGGWQPILWSGLFIALTSIIVVFGIEKGIERYNKILMPMLFLILIGLCINSFSLSGFKDGMSFLFRPDFSKVDINMVLNALGQAFFSLSLGMGTMMTYGSYIQKKDNLLSTSVYVATADILIALLAGIAIFPAVFSFGLKPEEGASLVFKVLPNIFAQMPGGHLLSIFFFLLLVVAALTSAVSVLEVLVAYFTEELKISRMKAVIFNSLFVFGVATLCSISQMPGSTIKIMGYNLFDFSDTLSSSYLLPIGGFFIVIYTAWYFNKKQLENELSSNGNHRISYYPFFLFLIRFIAPIAILAVFMSKIGVL